MSDVIRIDERFLLAGATRSMAWTNEQLKIVGAFPPRRGWKHRIVGRRITREEAIKFLTKAKTRRHRPKTEEEIALATAILSRYPSVPGISWRQAKAARKQDGDCACPLCQGSGTIFPHFERDTMAAPLRPCPLCFPQSAVVDFDATPRSVEPVISEAGDRPPWE